jgi:DNA-binding response OmpR family regulator
MADESRALSTRKLVLETGKFNVLTAHSTREGIDLFHMFPNVSGVVLVNGEKVRSEEIARAIRTATDKPPIIMLDPQPSARAMYANHTLSSYEPGELLDLLRELFGDPRNLDGK